MKVVIGLLTWNRAERIIPVLEHLTKAANEMTKLGYEPMLFVVDNASNDGTWEKLIGYTDKNWQYKKILIRIKCNIPIARNIVLHYARKRNIKYVFFLDDDVLLPPFAFEECLKCLEKDKKTTIAALAVTTYYGTYPGGILFVRDKNRCVEAKSLWMGATLLDLNRMPKDIWFNEKVLIAEDIKLCEELRRKGYKLSLVVSAKAIHWKTKIEDYSLYRTAKLPKTKKQSLSFSFSRGKK